MMSSLESGGALSGARARPGASWIARISEAWRAIERVCTLVAALALFATMLLVVADVFMRYALNRPFSFTYDLIGLYLLAVVFFFTISNALREHEHVCVDILLQRFPTAGRRLSELVTAATGLSVFCLVGWLGFERALDSYRQGDVLAGAIPWPTWLSVLPVPVGCGVLALRLALQFIGNLYSLATGADLYPLPPTVAEGRSARLE
ncbi:MAG TPA: TRAP transporter small permease [Bordetella sp.]